MERSDNYRHRSGDSCRGLKDFRKLEKLEFSTSSSFHQLFNLQLIKPTVLTESSWFPSLFKPFDSVGVPRPVSSRCHCNFSYLATYLIVFWSFFTFTLLNLINLKTRGPSLHTSELFSHIFKSFLNIQILNTKECRIKAFLLESFFIWWCKQVSVGQSTENKVVL